MFLSTLEQERPYSRSKRSARYVFAYNRASGRR